MKATILAALAAVAIGLPAVGPASAQPLRIIDGDTFVVMATGERIRIENIDAPEIHGQCDAERRLARLAGEALAVMLASGPVRIARKGQDRYRRTLARVFMGPTDVGQVLVDEGLARPWIGHREPWCTIDGGSHP